MILRALPWLQVAPDVLQKQQMHFQGLFPATGQEARRRLGESVQSERYKTHTNAASGLGRTSSQGSSTGNEFSPLRLSLIRSNTFIQQTRGQ